MGKNIIKIILDILMLLLLLLMYGKNSVSMSFHEVGGLVVCGLFLIHKGLNWKWIAAVSKRLFDKSLPAKTRLGYVVNVLLLVSTVFIAVSGVMISKTIFTGISGGGAFWKTGHFFAAAIALILAGIHIGLHWSFIKNMFLKVLKLPRAVARPLGIICLAALLAYGGYSIAATDFVRWLTSPFISAAFTREQMPQNGGERPEGMPQNGDKFEGMPQEGRGDSKGKGNGEYSRGFAAPNGSKRGQQNRYMGNSSLNLGRVIDVIISYGSIAAVFAALTLLIEKTLKRKRLFAHSKA